MTPKKKEPIKDTLLGIYPREEKPTRSNRRNVEEFRRAKFTRLQTEHLGRIADALTNAEYRAGRDRVLFYSQVQHCAMRFEDGTEHWTEKRHYNDFQRRFDFSLDNTTYLLSLQLSIEEHDGRTIPRITDALLLRTIILQKADNVARYAKNWPNHFSQPINDWPVLREQHWTNNYMHHDHAQMQHNNYTPLRQRMEETGADFLKRRSKLHIAGVEEYGDEIGRLLATTNRWAGEHDISKDYTVSVTDNTSGERGWMEEK